MIPSYGLLPHFNDKKLKYIFNEAVVVEEKIDGWQISFGVFEGERWIKTKNVLSTEGDEIWQPLQTLWESLLDLGLHEEWTYRGEFIDRHRMHKITYDTIPRGQVIIWDIDKASGDYLMPEQKLFEAIRVGFDCVVPVFVGHIKAVTRLPSLVPKTSVLGGRVEGIVVKNYYRQHNKKLLKGKYIVPEFRDAKE